MSTLTYRNIEVEDTFAEAFEMWVSRILITAENEKWALRAAESVAGFASSIIGSPAEAGIERLVPPKETPDGRTGVLVHFYHRTKGDLKKQMIA
ncbi:MAG: formylmethanofuran--tetrahydromethanopterin N-formyltransferase, partial [Thermoproteota archaeon]